MRTVIYVLISRDDGLQSTEDFSALYRFAAAQGVKITGGLIDFEDGNRSKVRSGRLGGRPRTAIPPDRAGELRSQGKSWREIARACGSGVSTVRRLYKLSSHYLRHAGTINNPREPPKSRPE
jgi:hypothetical protein